MTRVVERWENSYYLSLSSLSICLVCATRPWLESSSGPLAWKLIPQTILEGPGVIFYKKKSIYRAFELGCTNTIILFSVRALFFRLGFDDLPRCRRFAMVLNNGNVETLLVEDNQVAEKIQNQTMEDSPTYFYRFII